MKNSDEELTKWPNEIHDLLRAALLESGFSVMTPVQSICVPLILKKKDLAVEAVTGSGKTLAFLVPLMDWLIKNFDQLSYGGIYILILSPTRELAQQIYNVFSSIVSQCVPLCRHCLLIGGKQLENDVITIKDLRPHFAVSTPGRLVDLLKCKNVNMTNIFKFLEFLILDEADRLLDLGFETSINFILDCLPKQRRTSLFSATQTSDVQRLVKAGLRNPVCVTVKQTGDGANQRTPMWLKNCYVICKASDKFALLVKFLKEHRDKKIIVFFNTGYSVIYFARILRSICDNLKVFSMHRRVGSHRADVYEAFLGSSNTEGSILFCTDLMSRGIDIPAVDFVVQFDIPTRINSFIHRCGRTARCNSAGSAIIFLMPNEKCFVDFVENNQKVPLEQLNISTSDLSEIKLQVKQVCKRCLEKRAVKAFVSYINAYSNHELSLLLRIKELKLSGIAESFGLDKVPSLKENPTNCVSTIKTSKNTQGNKKRKKRTISKKSTNN